MNSALCIHNQACRMVDQLTSGSTVYGFGCRECGMKIMAGTWEDARTLFWLRAEKIKVRALMERRERGESLSAREERMVAYSIFGTASRCGY